MLQEIKKPLVFGDSETINIIKENEKIHEFNCIPVCDRCSGDGECPRCFVECLYCDGVGKDMEKLGEFRNKYPGWRIK